MSLPSQSLSFPRSRIVAVVGLDEVGRGCLAGPVCAAASLWLVRVPLQGHLGFDWHPHRLATLACGQALNTQREWLTRVGDSKKLSPARRAAVHESVSGDPLVHVRPIPVDEDGGESYAQARRLRLVKPARAQPVPLDADLPELMLCEVAVGAASAAEIDERNIWEAVQLAMGRALDSLALLPAPENVLLLVDGSLHIKVPPQFRASPQWTIVSGDARFTPIALASCVAKVQRDRWMTRLAELHPAYGFDRHAGYGTAFHMEAIRTVEPCVLHRRSFLGNILGCR